MKKSWHGFTLPAASPAPTMPPGLVEVMDSLSREVIKNNPQNLYKFCADHMKKLIELRKERESNISLSEKVHLAQKIVRSRYVKRWVCEFLKNPDSFQDGYGEKSESHEYGIQSNKDNEASKNVVSEYNDLNIKTTEVIQIPDNPESSNETKQNNASNTKYNYNDSTGDKTNEYKISNEIISNNFKNNSDMVEVVNIKSDVYDQEENETVITQSYNKEYVTDEIIKPAIQDGISSIVKSFVVESEPAEFESLFNGKDLSYKIPPDENIGQDNDIIDTIIDVEKELESYDNGVSTSQIAQIETILNDKESEVMEYDEIVKTAIHNSELQNLAQNLVVSDSSNKNEDNLDESKKKLEDKSILIVISPTENSIREIDHRDNHKINSSGLNNDFEDVNAHEHITIQNNNKAITHNTFTDKNNSPENGNLAIYENNLMSNSGYNDNKINLETAAATIQTIFKSFLFESKSSTLDDISNDEGSIDMPFLPDDVSSDDQIESGEKMDSSFVDPLMPTNERRVLTRMDTILQTVNEEKSLSLSDDSSTLSSAATVIQAHVRGFLVRNRLHSNKTESNSSFAISDNVSTSLDFLNEEGITNRNVLNINLIHQTNDEVNSETSPPQDHDDNFISQSLSYDITEKRKLLKREDAIQSISPPSNNSGKSEEIISPENYEKYVENEISNSEIVDNKVSLEELEQNEGKNSDVFVVNTENCIEIQTTLNKKDNETENNNENRNDQNANKSDSSFKQQTNHENALIVLILENHDIEDENMSNGTAMEDTKNEIVDGAIVCTPDGIFTPKCVSEAVLQSIKTTDLKHITGDRNNLEKVCLSDDKNTVSEYSKNLIEQEHKNISDTLGNEINKYSNTDLLETEIQVIEEADPKNDCIRTESMDLLDNERPEEVFLNDNHTIFNENSKDSLQQQNNVSDSEVLENKNYLLDNEFNTLKSEVVSETIITIASLPENGKLSNSTETSSTINNCKDIMNIKNKDQDRIFVKDDEDNNIEKISSYEGEIPSISDMHKTLLSDVDLFEPINTETCKENNSNGNIDIENTIEKNYNVEKSEEVGKVIDCADIFTVKNANDLNFMTENAQNAPSPLNKDDTIIYETDVACKDSPKLLHSSEMHDVIVTPVTHNDTSVVRGE